MSEGEYGGNIVYSCTKMNKMRPIETIPGMGGVRIKENNVGMNSTVICCKNFGKCHNIPAEQQ
jgi:hypothetical protein